MKHGKTIVFCLVTLIGSLSPSIITFITYLAKGNNISSDLFYSEGEFFIYAAALLTSAAYILYTYKVHNTDFISIMFWLSTGIIVFSAITYALIKAGNFTNLDFLRKSSYGIIIPTLFIFYYANLISLTKTDVIEQDHFNVDQMRKGLR